MAAGGATISRLYDFLDGMLLHDYHLDNEFDRIHQWINGKLGDINIAADADIQGAKIKVTSVPIDRILEGAYTKVEVDAKLANALLTGAVPDRSIAGLKLQSESVGIGELTPVPANLIPNSTWRLGRTHWNSLGLTGFSAVHNVDGGYLTRTTGTTAVAELASEARITVAAGTVLTFSGDMHAVGVTVGAMGMKIVCVNDANTILSQELVMATNGQGWTHYSRTFTTPAGTTKVYVACFLDINTTNTLASWRRLKLAKGSKDSIYTAEADLWPAQFPTTIWGLSADTVRGQIVETTPIPVWLHANGAVPATSTSISPTGTAVGGGNQMPFRYTRNDWGGFGNWQLEAFFKSSVGTVTAYVQLYDLTTATVVTQVQTASTNLVTVAAAVAGGLTADHDYVVMACVSAAGTVTVAAARLVYRFPSS